MEVFGRVMAVLFAGTMLFFVPAYYLRKMEQRCNRELLQEQLEQIYNEVRAREGWTEQQYQELSRLAALDGKRAEPGITVIKRKTGAAEQLSLMEYDQLFSMNEIRKELRENGFFPVTQGDAMTIHLHFPWKGYLDICCGGTQ